MTVNINKKRKFDFVNFVTICRYIASSHVKCGQKNESFLNLRSVEKRTNRETAINEITSAAGLKKLLKIRPHFYTCRYAVLFFALLVKPSGHKFFMNGVDFSMFNPVKFTIVKFGGNRPAFKSFD